MKKTIILAALSGTFAASASAQSSVTLYGYMDAAFVYSSNQGGHSSEQLVSSPTSNTVFGLKGTEDLGGGLAALFTLEQAFNVNNGTSAFAGDGFGSQAWVGLRKDNLGTLTLGRQFDVLNDQLGPLSAEYNAWAGSIAAHPFENDNLAADSVVVNNTIKYVSPTIGGATGEAMYSFSNKAGNFSNNRAYGFSGSYVAGALTVAAGYLEFEHAGGISGSDGGGAVSATDGSANFMADRQRIWGAGATYAFSKASVGFVWSRTQLDNMSSVVSIGAGSYLPLNGNLRMDNFEVNAKYNLTPALLLSGAYTLTDGAYSDGTVSASPLWHTGVLQLAYSLSKRTTVYVEGVYQHVHGAPVGSPLGAAMLNTLAPSTHTSQAALIAGIRHDF